MEQPNQKLGKGVGVALKAVEKAKAGTFEIADLEGFVAEDFVNYCGQLGVTCTLNGANYECLDGASNTDEFAWVIDIGGWRDWRGEGVEEDDDQQPTTLSRETDGVAVI